MTRPRLLFLGHVLPYPPDGGVRIRSFHVLRLLAREFSVDALCFFRQSAGGEADEVAGRVESLEEHVESVECFPIPQEESRARWAWDHLRSVAGARPYTYFTYDSDAFGSRLRKLVRRERYELVHVDSLDLSRHLSDLSGLTVVCAHHNVESELLRRRAQSVTSPVTAAYMAHQARLLEREEGRWCPEVSLNVCVSERDMAALQDRLPDAECAVVPNGVDTETFRPADDVTVGSEHGVVFVGGCNWFPNRDALEHFAGDILPLLRERHPDLEVQWVGWAEEETRRSFAREHGIEMPGYVEDIRPYVHGAACYVVPMRVGGGTRLKILDAWAMGKAVVSTSQGCEGLEARDGENILVRDSAPAFAEAVDRVLTDPDLRRRLGAAARRTAEEVYSWEVIGDEMNETYRALVGSRGPGAAERDTFLRG